MSGFFISGREAQQAREDALFTQSESRSPSFLDDPTGATIGRPWSLYALPGLGGLASAVVNESRDGGVLENVRSDLASNFAGTGEGANELASLTWLRDRDFGLGPATGALLRKVTPENTDWERFFTAQRDDWARLRRAYTVDPATRSEAANLIGGIAGALTAFTAGTLTLGPAVGPVAAGIGFGRREEENLLEQGADPETARRGGQFTGATMAAMGFAPVALPGRLLTRMASGAGMNLGFGAVQRGGMNAYLTEQGYGADSDNDLASQYQWLDLHAATIDAVLGAAFGGMFGRRAPPPVRPRETGEGNEGVSDDPAAPILPDSAEGFFDEARQYANDEMFAEAYAYALMAKEMGHPEAEGVIALLEEDASAAELDQGRAIAEEIIEGDRARDLARDQLVTPALVEADSINRETAFGVPANQAARRWQSETLRRIEEQAARDEAIEVGPVPEGVEFAPLPDTAAEHMDAALRAFEEEAQANRLDDLAEEIRQLREARPDVVGPREEGMMFSMGTRARVVDPWRGSERFVREGRREPLFSQGRPIFESAVERVVSENTTARANGSQWFATISKAKGVKREELEWIGLEDWLKARGSDSIPREEVLAFVRENGVRVEETVLGDKNKRDLLPPEVQRERLEMIEEKDRIERDLVARNLPRGADHKLGSHADPEVQAMYARIKEIDAALYKIAQQEQAEADKSEGLATRWSQYTLPGGENYRELLLRLPEYPEAGPLPDGWSIRQGRLAEMPDAPEAWITVDPSGKEWGSAANRSAAIFAARAEQARRDGRAEDAFPQQFRSSHFDQPNILAHVRFNERTDSNGKRTLFIEEVQSDWHQRGREAGYIGTNQAAIAESIRKALPNYDWGSEADFQYASPDDMAADIAEGGGARKDAMQEFRRLGVAEQTVAEVTRLAEQRGVVPDAPFKNNAWASLAMKRMIRWGSEQGFDSISWTRGQHQIERFNVEKVLDRIEYDTTTPGGNYLRAFKDGQMQIGRTVSPEELSGVVGKELAERLLAQPLDAARMHVLTGSDLRVGGEGMRAFYDRILPNIANDLGKKFGARVGETTIETGDGADAAVNRGDMDEDFVYDEAAQQVRTETVHSLPITPEMREQALEGQALFARGNGEGGSAAADLISRAEQEFGADWATLQRASLANVHANFNALPADIASVVRAQFAREAAQLGLSGEDAAAHIAERADSIRAIAYKGRAHFLADRISPEEFIGKVLHEIGAHNGMEVFLGKKGMAEVNRHIRRMIDEEHPIVLQAMNDAMEFGGIDNLNSEGAAYVVEHAALANLIEARPDLPLVQRVLSRIRQWLIKTFGSTFGMRLTVDDLRALAITSLRRVAEQARRSEVEASPIETHPLFSTDAPDGGAPRGETRLRNVIAEDAERDARMQRATIREGALGNDTITFYQFDTPALTNVRFRPTGAGSFNVEFSARGLKRGSAGRSEIESSFGDALAALESHAAQNPGARYVFQAEQAAQGHLYRQLGRYSQGRANLVETAHDQFELTINGRAPAAPNAPRTDGGASGGGNSGEWIDVWHGTPNQIEGELRPSRSGWLGPGLYASLSRGGRANDYVGSTGQVMPLQARGPFMVDSEFTALHDAHFERIGDDRAALAAAIEEAQSRGFTGVRGFDHDEVVIWPDASDALPNVRSRFAPDAPDAPNAGPRDDFPQFSVGRDARGLNRLTLRDVPKPRDIVSLGDILDPSVVAYRDYVFRPGKTGAKPAVAIRIVELSYSRNRDGQYLSPTETAAQMLREGFFKGKSVREAADLVDARRSLLRAGKGGGGSSHPPVRLPDVEARGQPVTGAQRRWWGERALMDQEAHRLFNEGDGTEVRRRGGPRSGPLAGPRTGWTLQMIADKQGRAIADVHRGIARHEARLGDIEAERAQEAAAEAQNRVLKEFGLPRIGRNSGYEARDIVLMFNERLTDAQIAAELEIAGAKVEVGTIAVNATSIRNAARKALATEGGVERLAEAMAITPDELTTFVENAIVSGANRRAPSMLGEARRLVREGVTETREIHARLREWASVNRIDEPADGTIEATAAGARSEAGLARELRAIPEDRVEEIVRLRKEGVGATEIAEREQLDRRIVVSVIARAKTRGEEFPRLNARRSAVDLFGHSDEDSGPMFSMGTPRQNRDNLVGAKRDPIESPDFQRRLLEIRERHSGQGRTGEAESSGAGSVRGVAGEPAVRGDGKLDAAELQDVLSVSGIHISTKEGGKLPGGFGEYTAIIDTPFASEADALLQAKRGADGGPTLIDFDLIDGSNPKETRLPGVHIRLSRLNDGAQGVKAGVWFYRQMIEWADRQGLPLYSDSLSVSADAQKLYDALQRRGYDVERLGRPKRSSDGSLLSTDGTPVYRVSRRGEIDEALTGAPLPREDYQIDGPTLRERQQRIDEQQKRQAEYDALSPAEQALRDNPEMKFSFGAPRQRKSVERINLPAPFLGAADVTRNPTAREIEAILVGQRKRDIQSVRWGITHNGDLLVWDGAQAMHAKVRQSLGGAFVRHGEIEDAMEIPAVLSTAAKARDGALPGYDPQAVATELGVSVETAREMLRRDGRLSGRAMIELAEAEQATAKEMSKAFEAAARCAARHGAERAVGYGVLTTPLTNVFLGHVVGAAMAIPAGITASNVLARNENPGRYARQRTQMAAEAVAREQAEFEREGLAAGQRAGLDAPTGYDDLEGEPLWDNVDTSRRTPEAPEAATYTALGGGRTSEGAKVPPAPPSADKPRTPPQTDAEVLASLFGMPEEDEE